jgi:hypothetical protein
MAFPTNKNFHLGYPANGFLIFRWSYFLAVQDQCLLNFMSEEQAFISGYWRPVDGRFVAFCGVLWLKNS